MSLGSINSCYQTVMGTQMCHTETMECLLRLDALSADSTLSEREAITAFGFTIQTTSFGSDVLLQPPVIGYLEPAGVAERYCLSPPKDFVCPHCSSLLFLVYRSGVLQPGDRILAINGQPLEGVTLEDARLMIKDAHHQLHLDIEFDVAGNLICVGFK